MAARLGMNQVINDLRGLADAGKDDFSNGTIDYWDDDQLQLVLDRNRLDLQHVQLTAAPQYPQTGGDLVFLEYHSPYGNLETVESGTAYFWLADSTGLAKSTATYSMDYRNGRATFTSDQAGTAIYLSGRAYDLYGAAADIWRQKAARYARQVNFSTDNHRFDRGAIMQHCLEMADVCEGHSWRSGRSIDLVRED